MQREQLRQIIHDQQMLRLPENYVHRMIDQDIKQLITSPQIGIITGIRRCGKSTVLQTLRKQQAETNYYLNFDDDRLIQFTVTDFQILLELFIELYGEQKTFYFDEIQNIPEWERFVRRLHDQGNKIYITGSNATMFSRELGTRLTGRYLAFEMYPFSFREYIDWKTGKEDINVSQLTTPSIAKIKKLFHEYLDEGGFPEYLRNKIPEYLMTLYESILYRDILARYKISNEKSLKELMLYLASNVGKDVSFNALKKMLGLGSATTISEYCSYLENSFLCFFINRYDYSLKKQIHYNKKSYLIDAALAKTIGFRFSEDRGRWLENIVFLELKRREKVDIYFSRGQYECDLVIRKGTKIIQAIQVAQQIDDPVARERELRGLLEAMQIHQLKEGYLLVENDEGTESIKDESKHYNVHIIPIWKWLLME